MMPRTVTLAYLDLFVALTFILLIRLVEDAIPLGERMEFARPATETATSVEAPTDALVVMIDEVSITLHVGDNPTISDPTDDDLSAAISESRGTIHVIALGGTALAAVERFYWERLKPQGGADRKILYQSAVRPKDGGKP